MAINGILRKKVLTKEQQGSIFLTGFYIFFNRESGIEVTQITTFTGFLGGLFPILNRQDKDLYIKDSSFPVPDHGGSIGIFMPR
jgi:CDP-diglyceride synthetase